MTVLAPIKASGFRASVRHLPDGRLHLSDGPIDLVIEAFGEPGEVAHAYDAAANRFVHVLDELCKELAVLRRPIHPGETPITFRSPVARAMQAAVRPHAAIFITPMAAVAGAVADDILAHMTASASLAKAYVNNGGDIALHLAPGQSFTTGLVTRPDRPAIFATTCIGAGDGIEGIATSGAPGRSFSRGIADAVTVLARTTAEADAAATVIANAVDLPGHPGILRAPASDLQPDSDLGAIPVTRHVPRLAGEDIMEALECGARTAEALLDLRIIAGAALHLQGSTRLIGRLRTLDDDRPALPREARTQPGAPSDL
ncbi:hypothetical protein HDIA_4445 [Hartmannibacter diazotrophicus]|uniref:Thiamine biosynthesis protein ApbE n=1 Tax=Hartmannibacter diazotrophicus TaxID=1482074 RepID=A0A2C9DCJ8_9HYPH|nr:UPF0280 family protein [Hartmannibacter diazotrophicus]SON57986.1 hypothetical protein HDIA_4445 [Hartmannibacter diazotrophicus]